MLKTEKEMEECQMNTRNNLKEFSMSKARTIGEIRK